MDCAREDEDQRELIYLTAAVGIMPTGGFVFCKKFVAWLALWLTRVGMLLCWRKGGVVEYEIKMMPRQIMREALHEWCETQ